MAKNILLMSIFVLFALLLAIINVSAQEIQLSPGIAVYNYYGNTVQISELTTDYAKIMVTVSGHPTETKTVYKDGEAYFEYGLKVEVKNIVFVGVAGLEQQYAVLELTLMPDFIVTDIQTNPSSPKDGEIGQINVLVKNQGTVGTSIFFVDIYSDNTLRGHLASAVNSAPGETYMITLNNFQFTSGSHTIKVAANPEGSSNQGSEIEESNNNNNEKSLKYTIATAKPDLTVTQAVMSHAVATDGQAGYFNALFKNNQQTASGSFYADYYIDNVFYKRTLVTSLSNYGSIWDNVPYTFKEGGHTLKVVADPINAVAETDETNNVYIYNFNVNSGKNIDLTVDSISMSPSNPKVGDIVTVTIVYKNLGSNDAGYPGTSYSLPGIRVADTQFIGDTYFTPGDTYTVINKIRMDYPGNYEINADIDNTNIFAETNENNNKLKKTFSIQGPSQSADLTVESITLNPSTPKVGEPATMTIVYRNNGNIDAAYPGAGWSMLPSYWTDTQMQYIGDTYLTPGDSYTVIAKVIFSKPGEYKVNADIDNTNLFAESNENNNKLTKSFSVIDNANKKPDFIVESIVMSPNNPNNGDTVNVAYTFKNIGTVSAQAGTTISFKDSNNNEIPQVSAQVTGDSYLDPQEAFIITITVKPSTGTYTASAEIDNNYVVDEYNEDNNKMQNTFYVGGTEGSKPDFGIAAIAYSPQNPKVGDIVTVTYSLINNGPTAGNINYHLYLNSPDKTLEELNREESGDNYLQSGEKLSVKIKYNLDKAGYHTANALIDESNSVDEGNEHNNYYATSFSVSPEGSSNMLVYLDQKFKLQEDQTANVIDYNNMEIKALSVEDDEATLQISGTEKQKGKIILHRDVLKCDDDSYDKSAPDDGKQVFEVGEGTDYWNFNCQNRKQEQCYDDGSFDTYYKEWCEYPTSTGFSTKIELDEGETETVNGVKITLVGLQDDTAILLVSKKYVEYGGVNIGIEPRVNTIDEDEKAEYILTVKDTHPQVAAVCTPDGSSCTSPKYTYNIAIFGLPFETNLPSTVTLNAGEKKEIKFVVDSSEDKQIPLIQDVSISVNSAGNVNSGQGTASIVFESETAAQEYCLNNADNEQKYNSCIKKINVKEAVTRETSRYHNTYKFAVRVYNGEASDVAFATLNIKSTDIPFPEFPTETMEIPLEKGWNLVSFKGSKFVGFESNTCTDSKKMIAFVYLPEQKRYVNIVNAKEILGNAFEEFLSKNSFWVYSFNDCDITVNIEYYVVYNDLSLSEGWNLLPITEDMIGKSTDDIDNNCELEKLYVWKDQQWERITEEYTFSSNDLGVVIKSRNYCQLGETVIDNPPALPN
ncbi:hypothetical protein C4573_04185 [Candidatus Woesearchaeota archaeon]|nr:MAG: hypothetical protein C4573_04185 [Candidatus Woesearchaeota archaeon]